MSYEGFMTYRVVAALAVMFWIGLCGLNDSVLLKATPSTVNWWVPVMLSQGGEFLTGQVDYFIELSLSLLVLARLVTLYLFHPQ